jgi:hypothetical protein
MRQIFKRHKFGKKRPGVRAGAAPTPKYLVRYLFVTNLSIKTNIDNK